MGTTLLSQSQNYGLVAAVYLWLFYVGFQSCHPHTEQFPSLSLRQQKQIMPLSTLHYRNLIEATEDEMDEENGSHRHREYCYKGVNSHSSLP